jgi:hypothetical protein
MTFQEMQIFITAVIQDTSFSVADIKARINSAVQKIAKGMKRRGQFQLSPPLPDLYKSNTVQTVSGMNRANLPDDFCRDVKKVLVEGDPVTIYNSLPLFRDKFPVQETGPVVGVCQSGSKIAYGDVPGTVTGMTVFYYAKPAVLTANDDTPDCIPDTLHEKLICGEVCRGIYSLIEDGMEGRKANTGYYADMVDLALETFELHIGRDEGGYNIPDSGDSYCE